MTPAPDAGVSIVFVAALLLALVVLIGLLFFRVEHLNRTLKRRALAVGVADTAMKIADRTLDDLAFKQGAINDKRAEIDAAREELERCKAAMSPEEVEAQIERLVDATNERREIMGLPKVDR